MNLALDSTSSTTRFGGVPISVAIPPMLLAKAKGIKNLPGLILALAAMLTTIGSMRATVPVLLTNAPIKAVTIMINMNNFNSLFPARRSILLLIILANPVLKIAPPTTNNPTIMMTIGLEKPESASSGVSMLNTINKTRAHRATRSERNFPLTKKTADRASIISVVIIGYKYYISKEQKIGGICSLLSCFGKNG